jgi:hypothetical protein
MHGTISTTAKTASLFSVNSDVDDENWFSEAAWRLYPTKPGTALHLVTALGNERLCQKYAAGDVRPPGYFLRRLQRSKHGEQWLNATMDGCTEQWWIDWQTARALCAQFQIIKRE